jgi:hypothetical protein
MLPLLNDASKGLQEVMKANDENNQEVIDTIIKHIDMKINELSNKCSNNNNLN